MTDRPVPEATFSSTRSWCPRHAITIARTVKQDQVEHGAILASAVQRINAGWILASDSGNFTLQYNQLGPSARLMVRRGRSAAFEHGVKADHSLGEQRSD